MRYIRKLVTVVLGVSFLVAPAVYAQSHQVHGVLFENVRIFDGTSDHLSSPSNVLVVGNEIKTISRAPITPPMDVDVTEIDGNGRTLMPGLIDAHWHSVFAAVSMPVALNANVGYVMIAAGKEADATLMRGFTSVRDLGGPSFGLKRAIDDGTIIGPRIWPSGAFISQTGGHGDFRPPTDIPSPYADPLSYSEKIGAAAIADGIPEMHHAVREQLLQGASQIKVMAGGGVASSYDPIDVTEYTEPEIHAAVEDATNWGTYVTVHAYTSRAVREAIKAGVKCIEHGMLIDDSTAKLMADKGIWWSLQPFVAEFSNPLDNPENRAKQKKVEAGTANAYRLAKKYRIKIAFGTDVLFSKKNTGLQGAMLVYLQHWFTPAEVLQMATSSNAKLLALSGPRSPYKGTLGVVKQGAFADLLLVDGNPLENLSLIAQPETNFVVIMKSGVVYKNALSK